MKFAAALTAFAAFATFVSATDGPTSSCQMDANTTTESLLPVIFFHGLTRNAADGDNIKAALAAQGRHMVALNFASDANSSMPLNKQIPLAIEQIRSIVASDDRFQNGYIFVGHSQGGLLARTVVEEMDEHKVHTLISLAGAQNGFFYGPQADDAAPLQTFFSLFGPVMLPGLLDYEDYSANSSTLNGEFQQDLAIAVTEHKELQEEVSFANMIRMPSLDDFLSTNTFLPKINNVNKAESAEDIADQERRKSNFLKLKDAYFFISPTDGFISPYQMSIFGRYSEVDSLEEIGVKFQDLKVVGMQDTTEYINDTFGLRTLDERGGLHCLVVPNVPHAGWLVDSPLSDDPTQTMEFQTVFDNYIKPALP